MSSQLIATGNEFSGNTALYGGAIYSSNILLGFSFSDNIFSENDAYDGGAIYKKSVGIITIVMNRITIFI